MKLSIIIPVYNVEQYIRPCVESIYRQGLDEDTFEVIIVNDGSQDKSFEIISDVITEHSNIVVIEQPNQGLSVARNTGLSNASGQYIMFVDSDDLLVEGSLKKILTFAIDSSVDMAIAGFVKMTDREIIDSPSSLSRSCSLPIIMTGCQAFLNILNPSQCYVWHSLYRRGFITSNCLQFIPGIYFEDIPFTTECYLKADKVLIYDMLIYIYRQHSNSIVSTINLKKLLDFNIVIKYLWELKNKEDLSSREKNKLSDVLFSTFSHEMWYVINDKSLYKYRRIVIENLKNEVPNLYFNNGIKQRTISLFFNFFPFFYLKIRQYFAKI